MREVTKVTDTESEAGYYIDMGSFLLRWVMAGHEIESEVGFCVDTGSFSLNQLGHSGYESEVGLQLLHNPSPLSISVVTCCGQAH